MATSTLFFQNLTAIDHALLDPKTITVRGGSYNVSIWVTGEIEEHEQVVVDFSTLKKTIKGCIDDKCKGFDHKLWTIPDFVAKHNSITDSVFIETENFVCLVPKHTVKVLEDYELGMEEIIAEYLTEELNDIYPNSGLTCRVFLTEEMNSTYSKDGQNMLPFRYIHGLKNSTSLPCQNINHGHLSYMGLIDPEGNSIPILKELPIMNKYNDVIFVWKDNIISKTSDWLTVGYNAPEGTFLARYRRSAHNIIETPMETTVENLANWIREEHEYELTRSGAEYFLVSEGLAKGAVIQI